MKINENIYPYNAEARKLPVHLTGIGGSEYQYHIIRNEGYHWHQILYSAGGSGILKYDNSSIVINQGDFFFLPAGYPHEYYTENSEWDVRWVAFDTHLVLIVFNSRKESCFARRTVKSTFLYADSRRIFTTINVYSASVKVIIKTDISSK